MRETSSPLEYLFLSSEAALESIHLSGLNRGANLRKQLREILQAWIESEVQARVAMRLRDGRRPHGPRRHAPAPALRSAPAHEQLKIEFLPPTFELSGAPGPASCSAEGLQVAPNAPPSRARSLRADDAPAHRSPLFCAGATDAARRAGRVLRCNVTRIPGLLLSTTSLAREELRSALSAYQLATPAYTAALQSVAPSSESSRAEQNAVRAVSTVNAPGAMKFVRGSRRARTLTQRRNVPRPRHRRYPRNPCAFSETKRAHGLLGARTRVQQRGV